MGAPNDDYRRLHRYGLSPESVQWLRREAPFVLALIEAPGSRLTQCARGISEEVTGRTYPVKVEVGRFTRITTPVAATTGTLGLIGLVVGSTPLFIGGMVLAAIALVVGRQQDEEWVLAFDERVERVADVIANASISHDLPNRLMRMADYLLVTDQGKYLWDSDTYRVWESQGSPEAIVTFGLTAVCEGRVKEGEELRALQV